MNLRDLAVKAIGISGGRPAAHDSVTEAMYAAGRGLEGSTRTPPWLRGPTRLVLREQPERPTTQLYAREVTLPTDRPFSLHLAGDRLTIQVPPSRGVDEAGKPLKSAGEAATLRLSGSVAAVSRSLDFETPSLEGFAATPAAEPPTDFVVREDPDSGEDFVCTLVLDLGKMDDLTPLVASSLEVGAFQFHRPLTRTDERPVSLLLEGEARFPNLEIDPIELGYHEMVRVDPLRDAGYESRFKSIVLANRDAMGGPGRAEDRVPIGRTALAFHWSGPAQDVQTGAQGYARSRMPAVIFSVLGSRERLYVLGVVLYGAVLALSLLRRRDPGAADFLNP